MSTLLISKWENRNLHIEISYISRRELSFSLKYLLKCVEVYDKHLFVEIYLLSLSIIKFLSFKHRI